MTTWGGYVDPLRAAHVTPERIDMGVDYAGTGQYVALGKAIITEIVPGGWGSYGNYMQYRLLDGPLKGQTVYYAEGVNPVPGLKVGQVVQAGQPVASLIPGWHSGTELGFGGSSSSTSTYASQLGGGYTEGQRTAAGQAFSNLIQDLGGAPGLPEGRPITGTYSAAKIPAGGGSLGGASTAAGASVSPGAGGGIIPSWITDIGSFLSNPLHALVTIALVIGGAFVFYKGLTRSVGIDQPKRKAG